MSGMWAETREAGEALRRRLERHAPRKGITVYWVWNAVMDGRTCGACAGFDEQRAGIGVAFPGDSVQRPEYAPPLHERCRCSLSLVAD